MSEQRHLIFVNYRGSDEMWATEFVYARLTEAFGPRSVFKAGNALKPGQAYSPVLQEKAAHCPIMIVCIGPSWLSAQDADGHRRLDSRKDWVREEITIALRAGNRVIPVLLGNHDEVCVPKEDELPKELRPLVGRQAPRLVPGGGLDLTVPNLIEKLVDLEPELGHRRAALHPAPAGALSDDPRRTRTEPSAETTASAVFHINTVEGDAVNTKTVYQGFDRPRT
jgi:hypothetical protein